MCIRDSLTAATHLPFNVDSERLYGDDAAGIAECVGLLAGAGAAGCSIADWNPCLLYTSDAGDQRSSVDLGGRRILKKKRKKKNKKRQHV